MGLTQPLKRNCKKVPMNRISRIRNSVMLPRVRWREFQILGATTSKDLPPVVERRVRAQRT